MEATESGFGDLQRRAHLFLHSLWKRRWQALAAAWIVGLLAIPIVMLVPNRYEAAARVYVDTDTVLKPMMSGLAFTPDIDLQVRMLARTLISRPNIEQLVSKPDLNLNIGSSRDRERMIQRFMDEIKIEPAGVGNLYSIKFRDTDAGRANRIVEATLELFVASGAQSKKRDTAEASEFIDQQIHEYEGKLIAAENRLKEFKVRNFGVSGVSNQDFFSRISVLADEVNKLHTELASAEQSREAYRKELAGESPQLPLDASSGTPAVASTEVEVRLEAQRKTLDELLRRYTDEHPDVVASRRVIAQLERERRLEAEAKASAVASGKSKLAATSPVYQKIRIALADAEAQVASLRSQLAQREAKLRELRSTAGKMPQIEAELAQLNRDYDVINKNYQALVARRESASLGIKLDESSRLADFRVVEPPRVTPRPVFPSRLHVAGIAILLAFAAGVIVPLVAGSVWPTYRDQSSLSRATGRPVLGSVSVATNPAAQLSIRRQGFAVAGASLALLFVQAGWLTWLATRFGS